VLNDEREIVLKDDVKNEQNVLGVLSDKTAEEMKEPTVETPIGRMIGGKRFTEISCNIVLR